MNSCELRQKFLEFFKNRGHAIVPSSSLLPPSADGVLLTTAGMQQFKPYFVGKADPRKDFGSLNTASIQKSFRTSDINEVGDETHLTFFEMLGNFSFEGYFKKEAIEYAKEFIESIGLTIQYVTIFIGDEKTPKDTESEEIWRSLGISDIREAGREDNFWGPTGNEGPCGPTTEIYIDDIEIWNIVFNEYSCTLDGKLEKLKTPGVDTGMGLERLAMVAQSKSNIFETDLFKPLISALPSAWTDERIKRIIADHVRAIAFLISDGVRPSNTGAGYILRRLMRRIIIHIDRKQSASFSGSDTLPMGVESDIKAVFEAVIRHYSDTYPGLNKDVIFSVFDEERKKFGLAFRRGLREMQKMPEIDGSLAFKIYESYGLPFELIQEFGGEKVSNLRREDFDEGFKKHQKLSRVGQEKKFGGHGLILDTGELKAANAEELKVVTRLHTATHLLQAALRKVLGDKVHQAGSDITAERLRFDFTFEQKLTNEEIAQVEGLVNVVVEKNFDMGYMEMPYEEAVKTGALYFRKEKYPATVKVYSAIDPRTGEVFSRELCGGPHVSHTRELRHFKITKEESIGSGVRRIRAVVE